MMQFALGTATRDIDREVLRKAAQRVVDTVGVALAAVSSAEGTAATKVVSKEAGEGEASLWGAGGVRRPAALACFANGTAAHGIEYDDTHIAATLHPGVVIVPTAVAVGEEIRATGPDVLASVAVGYEIATRLGRLASGRFQAQGFHPSAVLGIFGATAAAARLMRLGDEDARSAAGLAGSMSSGLMEYLADGTSAKQFHPGWAAQGAVRAVQLASEGMTGPRTVLEGERGVFRAFISQDVDTAAFVEGLGETWSGLDVATKPYAACHCAHAPVDAWHLIRSREGLWNVRADDLERLVALVPEWYRQLVADPLEEKREPRSTYEARFSLPFAIASAVIDGGLSLSSFDVEKLDDREILALAQRVDVETVEYETFTDAFPGGLRVELADGRVFVGHLDHNVGSTLNPMSAEQIEGKFLEAAGRLAGEVEAKTLLGELKSLENEDSDLSGFRSAMDAVGRNSVD